MDGRPPRESCPRHAPSCSVLGNMNAVARLLQASKWWGCVQRHSFYKHGTDLALPRGNGSLKLDPSVKHRCDTLPNNTGYISHSKGHRSKRGFREGYGVDGALGHIQWTSLIPLCSCICTTSLTSPNLQEARGSRGLGENRQMGCRWCETKEWSK